MAGLEPAIHPCRKPIAKMMDARVIPAHDSDRDHSCAVIASQAKQSISKKLDFFGAARLAMTKRQIV
jgi:hypothetical protein